MEWLESEIMILRTTCTEEIKMKKKIIIIAILAISLIGNVAGVGYILKKEVYIVFKHHYYLGRRQEEEADYNKIDYEAAWVRDEAMAIKLAEAYLGDRLNYSGESLPLFTTAVSFDEEKYEYLVQIIIRQRAGVNTGAEVRFLVGIRKDCGIVTFYEE